MMPYTSATTVFTILPSQALELLTLQRLNSFMFEILKIRDLEYYSWAGSNPFPFINATFCGRVAKRRNENASQGGQSGETTEIQKGQKRTGLAPCHHRMFQNGWAMLIIYGIHRVSIYVAAWASVGKSFVTAINFSKGHHAIQLLGTLLMARSHQKIIQEHCHFLE